MSSDFVTLDGTGDYFPIEDHGLIGDGTTAALVRRDGAIVWMCLPRFDSQPLFCAILDARRGGSFQIRPQGLVASRQFYEPDTGVLHTELRTVSGALRLTDAMTLHGGADLTEDAAAARQELVRVATALAGDILLEFDLSPRGDCRAEPAGGGLKVICSSRPDLALHLSASQPLAGLRTRFSLRQGESAAFVLRWSGGGSRYHPVSPGRSVAQTADVWRRWIDHFRYRGPQKALVRRSAITLKLLDYFESGAIIAAPTSSLPEAVGGVRNWDYRFVWIRDAAFSVFALHRIGYSSEAAAFLAWVLDAVERHGRPKVLYDLDGLIPQPERVDTELEGYRASVPVRWGNDAAEQLQHDVYGEILDCAYQWAAHHGAIDGSLWRKLSSLVEAAAVEWRKPDHGIWEVRTAGRTFTYSAAMCQVALDRGARLAERFGLPGDSHRWRVEAERIRQAILDEAFDPGMNSLRRMQQALDLYDSLCARAGPLGLLPEQIDPSSGAFLGNYPQAFSHIGVISSGFNLGRLLTGASEEPITPKAAT